MEVPTDWDRVQHLWTEISLEWRQALREVLSRLLQEGYFVVHLARVPESSLDRSYLYLVRRQLDEVLAQPKE